MNFSLFVFFCNNFTDTREKILVAFGQKKSFLKISFHIIFTAFLPNFPGISAIFFITGIINLKTLKDLNFDLKFNVGFGFSIPEADS